MPGPSFQNLLSLALPLVFLFAAFLAIAWRKTTAFFGAVLILLLLHEYILRVSENLLGVSPTELLAISLWKEVAFAALLVTWLVRAVILKDGSSTFRWLRSDVVLAAWVLLGLTVAGFSQNRIAAMAVLRDYLEPLLFYFGARMVLLSKQQMRNFLAVWLGLGGLLAVFAIWQGLGWSPEDFVAWGYGAPTSQTGIPYRNVLGRYIIRPPATLTGPNELAVHMMLVSLFVAQRGSFWKSARGLTSLGVLVVAVSAILVTTSRSGIFGLLVGIVILAANALPRRLSTWFRRQGWRIAIALLLVAAMVGLLVMVLNPARSLANELWRRIGSDYHTLDSVAAVQFLLVHPGGVGLGEVGPRQGFGIPKVLPYHVEGSLFQIGMETGFLGLALFLLFVGVCLNRVWKKWHTVQDPLLRALCGTALAGWVGALVGFAFLPLMQALPLMAWLWFFMGLALSSDQLEARWAVPLGAVRVAPRADDSGANMSLLSP